VEALLEAGRVVEATQRAGAARTLAADGLAEARRAVHALRDDAEADTDTAATTDTAPVAAPGAGLHPLVAAHRDFGGELVVTGDLALADLDDAHRAVVVASTREALSNARRHAPGRPVSLSVIRDGDAVDVVVANPLSGGGHGLIGIHERFAELDAGATVEAERSEDEFVVAMHVPVAGARVDEPDAQDVQNAQNVTDA
jgi:signal transduction histidine kinase